MDRRVKCLILNDSTDEYGQFWEIFSILSSYFPERSKSEIVDLFYENLQSLYDDGLIAFYRGIFLKYDETLVENFNLTREYINEHKEDGLKKLPHGEHIRFYITPKGEEFLVSNCYRKDFEK